MSDLKVGDLVCPKSFIGDTKLPMLPFMEKIVGKLCHVAGETNEGNLYVQTGHIKFIFPRRALMKVTLKKKKS